MALWRLGCGFILGVRILIIALFGGHYPENFPPNLPHRNCPKSPFKPGALISTKPDRSQVFICYNFINSSIHNGHSLKNPYNLIKLVAFGS